MTQPTQPGWTRGRGVPDSVANIWAVEHHALPKTSQDAAEQAQRLYLAASTLYESALKNGVRGRRLRKSYQLASVTMAAAQWLLLEEARLRATGH